MFFVKLSTADFVQMFKFAGSTGPTGSSGSAGSSGSSGVLVPLGLQVLLALPVHIANLLYSSNIYKVELCTIIRCIASTRSKCTVMLYSFDSGNTSFD